MYDGGIMCHLGKGYIINKINNNEIINKISNSR